MRPRNLRQPVRLAESDQLCIQEHRFMENQRCVPTWLKLNNCLILD